VPWLLGLGLCPCVGDVLLAINGVNVSHLNPEEVASYLSPIFITSFTCLHQVMKYFYSNSLGIFLSLNEVHQVTVVLRRHYAKSMGHLYMQPVYSPAPIYQEQSSAEIQVC
jgi:hypothetical protein